MEYIDKPALVEPNVKYFLQATLQKCNKFKERHINFFYNLGLGIMFCIILFVILYFNFKGNNTAKEMKLKKMKDKEYIIKQLIRIKQQNINDRKMSNNMITDLPTFKNHPEASLLENKKYNHFINDQ